MKDVHNGLGVKNMSDLILKEIYSIYETKNLTNKQIQKYKMTEREIFEKYDNLSQDELNTKTNKNVYVKNEYLFFFPVAEGEKRGERKIDGFRKKLMIPESEIPECPKYKVKSKIGKIFVIAKILEEYSVKILKTDPYYKYKSTKMGVNTYYLELMFALLNIF